MQFLRNLDIPEEDFESAFLEFTQKVYDFCAQENNKRVIYFTLHYLRGLLLNLAGKEQIENCPLINSGIHFLDAALEWVGRNEYQTIPNTDTENTIPKVVWTGKIVHFVEWIYGPHALKHFNNGDITAKDLINHLSHALNIEVKDPSGCYVNMRERVQESRTTYIDSMREALLKRMEKDDEKAYRRKR